MYGHKVRVGSTTTLENQNQTGGFALTAPPVILCCSCYCEDACCISCVALFWWSIIST